MIAQQLSWSVLQTTAGNTTVPPTSITYTVSEKATRIDAPAEVVFIDYRQRRLYRQRLPGESCQAFAFASPPSILPIAQTRVIATEEKLRLNSQLCTKKLLYFGSDLAIAQTMVPPSVQHYGQVFTIRVLSYWVPNNSAGFHALFDVSRNHRQTFTDFPLLRQIDPLGVVDLLQGFPLQCEEMLTNGRLVSTLEVFPPPVSEPLAPPQSCRFVKESP